MDVANFTIKSQEALQRAQEIAAQYSHQAVENAHLLRGIQEVDNSVFHFLLKKFEIKPDAFNMQLEQVLKSYPKVDGGNLYLSAAANTALQKAVVFAQEVKDEFISVEHLIAGILSANDDCSKLLRDLGMTEKNLRNTLAEMRKGSRVTGRNAEDNYHALKKYAMNLNEMARNGKLDPVIGRDEEIRRVLHILTRRTKNNPILIGEPGVGKTAIAEGIAHRIVRNDVPENLKTKQVFSLDMAAIIAGAKYKGEFEERLKSVIKEVITSDGEIVLFIDEIHTLVGAGGGEGAMDAANILKPALSRGELRAIGATTINEYQKYIEKDRALERRFQKVLIEEPSPADAVSILRGLKERYERYHKVRIKDEAIESAVELSHRYITDRYLPDKAIDLIDEASARLRMEINSMPAELDEVDRKIKQLEIEREAIKIEKDQKKLKDLAEKIANLTEQKNSLNARWLTEKEIVEGIQREKEAIERFRFEADRAERDGNYGKVAELRYGKIKEAEKQLEKLEAKITEIKKNHPLIKEEVDSEDIAGVVARWTGIPVSRMLEDEKAKLLVMEDYLHTRVIGQDEAILAVSDAVRRSRAGLQDVNRPIGSFIFLGPTGVGKTELAKALAEFLFNTESSITRIDMSEYQERHSVSRLIGAPPGYVGYEESGQLTEAVRKKPYSVVLLDEIEKAHSDVFNILLQVLDEGRLTDNKGRVANFKNSLIIMTSNMGSHVIQENFDRMNEKNKDDILRATRAEVELLLKQTIRPEFLNRVDDIIMFSPLTRKNVRKIVNLQLEELITKLATEKISIRLTSEAVNWIIDHGFDPLFGARPIRRVIQKQIVNELAKHKLAGEISGNSPVLIDVFDDRFVFRNEVKETKSK
ncbi:MAG: ATP-dependent chaperone ClpB [Bacteroidetes bacterium]|nr:ATP-dependent chaperone ClpB [Bacteroidota bacterium]